MHFEEDETRIEVAPLLDVAFIALAVLALAAARGPDLTMLPAGHVLAAVHDAVHNYAPLPRSSTLESEIKVGRSPKCKQTSPNLIGYKLHLKCTCLA